MNFLLHGSSDVLKEACLAKSEYKKCSDCDLQRRHCDAGFQHICFDELFESVEKERDLLQWCMMPKTYNLKDARVSGKSSLMFSCTFYQVPCDHPFHVVIGGNSGTFDETFSFT